MAFDVKVEKDAQDLADTLHVKIFQADIIYHLFDKFIAYQDDLKAKKRDEFKSIAVFPCKLKVSRVVKDRHVKAYCNVMSDWTHPDYYRKVCLIEIHILTHPVVESIKCNS